MPRDFAISRSVVFVLFMPRVEPDPDALEVHKLVA
jgi:hypothetical protein